MKKYLIILKQAPYINSLSLEALELSMALAAFDQPLTLLFMGSAVLQLLNQQQPEYILHKDFTKAFAGLDLFEINQVYLELDAVELFGLDSNRLSIYPAPLAAKQIAELISQHDIILTI
jgi:tRNA 2-thiouridine synthesizing protein C